MARLTIVPAEQAAQEVDLWGNVYRTVPLTRTRQREYTELQERFAALDDSVSEDEGIELLAKMLGTLVAAVKDDSPDPAELIIEKWNGDELDSRWLFALLTSLNETSDADPT